MKDTIAEKLLVDPLVDGELGPESKVGLKIDQVLTRDATGTMVYLEFEAMGVPMAKASAAVNCDQNIIQTDSRNADDSRFLQFYAAKLGITFSPPGKGVFLPCSPSSVRSRERRRKLLLTGGVLNVSKK